MTAATLRPHPRRLLGRPAVGPGAAAAVRVDYLQPLLLLLLLEHIQLR